MSEAVFNRYSEDELEEVLLEDAAFDLQMVLRDALGRRKVSQKELAQRVGVSDARISQILNGSGANFQIGSVVKLLLALDMRLDLSSVNAVELATCHGTEIAVPNVATSLEDERRIALRSLVKLPQAPGWKEHGIANRNVKPLKVAA